MSRRSRFFFTRLSLPLAALLACDDSATAPIPGEAGTFSAEVSGGAARALSGRALFATDVAGPEYGFAIALIDSIAVGSEGTVRHAVYIYREVGGVPAPGEHDVGRQGIFQIGLVLDGDGDDPLFCIAASGTVEITRATPSAVRGRFDVEAVCVHGVGGGEGGTIQASGAFRAASGAIEVPDDVIELPGPEGRFELRSAGGSAIPATVFDGVVLVGDDQFVHLEITVTGGAIELYATGGYEQRVTQEVRVDGQPAPSLDWVDHGTCVILVAKLDCMSTRVQNRAFTATLVDGALEIPQDLNGEGVTVVFRYVREG
jgi:hypothetical protein